MGHITITMTGKKTAEEKILDVLDCIKEQYDLSPKGRYSTHVHFGTYYVHPEGEVKLSANNLMAAAGVDYFELEKILAKLQEDGLIQSFRGLSEYE